MFNNDFYPTPREVVERMLLSTNVNGKIILEPSAGKGNIISVLKEYDAKEVIACEISNDLAKVAASKSDRFLKADFLDVTAEEISHIDMIVMNPPFSKAEEHILHAYEIAPGGCTIISLCNQSVFTNTFISKREKIKTIIESYGRKESFEDCFRDAERRTNVEVGCLWIYKEKTGKNEFDDFFSLEEEPEQTQDGIQRYNYVRDIVSRYVDAVSRFDKVMDAAREINEVTNTISPYSIKFGACGKDNHNITRDIFKKDLQKRCWRKIFDEFKMDKYLTSGVKENINKFVETQERVPFTMKNVYKMIEIVVGTHSSRMDQVIVEGFEKICSYAWKENCTGGEHWKTNSDYMINRKFIVPYICEYDTRCPSSTVKLGYGRNRDSLDDIVKALCHITGTNYETVTRLNQFAINTTGVKTTDENRYKSNKEKGFIPMEWGQWYDWGFFRIRGYKKGTMHFEFQDKEVWAKFNQAVAKIKGWRIPENVKRRKAA